MGFIVDVSSLEIRVASKNYTVFIFYVVFVKVLKFSNIVRPVHIWVVVEYIGMTRSNYDFFIFVFFLNSFYDSSGHNALANTARHFKYDVFH